MKDKTKIIATLSLTAALLASLLAVPVMTADTDANAANMRTEAAAKTDYDCITETGTSLSGQKIAISTYPNGDIRSDKKISTIVTMTDGRRYIVYHGDVERNTLVDIYGSTYAVKEDGTVCSDEFFGNRNDYYAGKDGRIAKSSVITIDGREYATDRKGHIVKNYMAEVKGKHDRTMTVMTDSDGIIYKDCFVRKGGRLYHAGKTGEIDRDKVIDVKDKKYAADKIGMIAEVPNM